MPSRPRTFNDIRTTEHQLQERGIHPRSRLNPSRRLRCPNRNGSSHSKTILASHDSLGEQVLCGSAPSRLLRSISDSKVPHKRCHGTGLGQTLGQSAGGSDRVCLCACMSTSTMSTSMITDWIDRNGILIRSVGTYCINGDRLRGQEESFSAERIKIVW